MLENSGGVKYDVGEIETELGELFAEGARFLRDPRRKEILGHDLQKSVQDALKAAQRRLQTEFRLVIAGEFKRGKSTLLNAFLGCEIVPTNVTPETVTFIEIGRGTKNAVRLHTDDGGFIELETEDLKRERFEAIVKQLGQGVSHVTADFPEEALEGIRIVDTPGTGDLFKQYDEKVITYLDQADSLLYVVSANSPLSKTELSFLRLALAPQNLARVVFVVNMVDALSSWDDANRIKARVESIIREQFPDSPVFVLSALDELARRVGKARPQSVFSKQLESAFEEFRRYLDQAILLNRDFIRLERAGFFYHGVIQAMKKRTGALLSTIQIERNELMGRIENLRTQNEDLGTTLQSASEMLAAKRNQLEKQAIGWVEEFVDRFADEVPAKLKGLPFASIRKHFQFFFADTFRRAVELIVAPSIIEMEKTVAGIVGDDRSGLDLPIDVDLGYLHGIDYDVQTADGSDSTAGIMKLLPMGINMIPSSAKMVAATLQLAGGAAGNVAALSRESEQESKGRDALIENLKKVLPDLKKHLVTSMRQIHEQMTTGARTELSRTIESQHQELLTLLEESKALQEKGTEQLDRTTTVAEELMTELLKTEARLDRINTKLGSMLMTN